MPSPRVLVLVALASALTGGAFAPVPVDIEVRSDAKGAYAYRERGLDDRWALPTGDAVLIDEAWWTPLRPLVEVAPPPAAQGVGRTTSRRRLAERLTPPWARAGERARVTAVAVGDVTQDGEPELVVSFRRPFRRTYINATRPRSAWVDENGRSAHLGLYRPDDLSEIWVAGTLTRPVAALAACDTALAVAYDRLDDERIIETGAWRWVVFGFLPVEPLPGPGVPACVDIDGDGRTEPAILERSAR